MLGIVGTLAVALVAALKAKAPLRTSTVMAIILSFVIGGFAQPALAAAANDAALSEGQKALNEKLRTDPDRVQYEGIEYPNAEGTPLSDREITSRIYNKAPDNLKVSVSNGAVRLSGTVKNQRVAQEIVRNVREIPGVHEVSYDLGTAQDVTASK
jgi:osmotically-inducible protein OsmY